VVASSGEAGWARRDGETREREEGARWGERGKRLSTASSTAGRRSGFGVAEQRDGPVTRTRSAAAARRDAPTRKTAGGGPHAS
jgi:hypothetical protein